MIKINLYGSNSSQAGGSSRSDGAAGSSQFPAGSGITVEEGNLNRDAFVNLVILFIPMLALYAYQEMVLLPDLMMAERAQQQELSQLRGENSKNQAYADEAKQFNSEKEKLEAQIKAIQKLSNGRMNSVRGLEALQTSIPTKVWVDSLNLNGQRLMIEGTALTDLDISNFMESISGSNLLSDVELLSAEQSQSDVIGVVKEFSVSTQLERGD